MVDKCINPNCQKPLHYLRDGRVFLFSRKNTGENAKLPHRLEHYWLCGECAQQWTLKMDAECGVQVVAAKQKSRRSPGVHVRAFMPAS